MRKTMILVAAGLSLTITDLLAMADGLFSTAIQTVGQKGWDDMTISIVEG